MSFAVLDGGDQRGHYGADHQGGDGLCRNPGGLSYTAVGSDGDHRAGVRLADGTGDDSGRSHAAETIRTYGEHLHDWFDSLEQSGLDWRAVSEAEIAACRNRMLSQPSPHTKRPYARSTVNDRVRTVCRFYAGRRDAAGSRACRSTLSMCGGPAADNRSSAHVNAHPGVVAANILTVAEHERLPRPLRVDQLRRVFAQLEMPYRLMAEWALATGLRRKELCGLAVFQVPETAHLDDEDHPLVGVPLTITKGDKPRTIYPPIGLVDRTQRYIDEVRTPQVRALRRQRSDNRPPRRSSSICRGMRSARHD